MEQERRNHRVLLYKSGGLPHEDETTSEPGHGGDSPRGDPGARSLSDLDVFREKCWFFGPQNTLPENLNALYAVLERPFFWRRVKSDKLLGREFITDGGGDDGRHPHCHHIDALLPARALCCMVSRAAGGGSSLSQRYRRNATAGKMVDS